MQTSGVTVRLFIGCVLTPDIGMALAESPLWQQRHLAAAHPLLETRYQERSYVGHFFTHNHPSLPEIRQAEQAVRTALTHHCPTLDIETLPFTLFPQVFIS